MKWVEKTIETAISVVINGKDALACSIFVGKDEYYVLMNNDGKPSQRELALMEEFSTGNVGYILYDVFTGKYGLVVINEY